MAIMMDPTPAISHDVFVRTTEVLESSHRRGFADRRQKLAARARRVVLLLMMIWILGLADLFFTLQACDIGGFVEANPVVAQILHAPQLLIVFKLALLTFASVIFYHTRRRKLTEFSCWGLGVVHFLLAVVWLLYYYGLE